MDPQWLPPLVGQWIDVCSRALIVERMVEPLPYEVTACEVKGACRASLQSLLSCEYRQTPVDALLYNASWLNPYQRHE